MRDKTKIFVAVVVWMLVSPFAAHSQQSGPQGPQTPPENTQNQQPTTNSEKIAAPSFLPFKLFTADGEKQIAGYCAGGGDKEKYDWSHKYMCDIRITDVYIAFFTFCLGAVTIGLIIVGSSTVRTMLSTERRQLRAYIGVESIIDHFPNIANPAYQPRGPVAGQSGQDFLIVRVRNFGSTPANQVTCWVNWIPLPYANRLPENFAYPDIDTVSLGSIRPAWIRATIFPTQSIPYPVTVNDLRPFIATHAQQATLYVYGHIDYIDVYGISRTTTFCYSYEPWHPLGERFVPYEDHNQAY